MRLVDTSAWIEWLVGSPTGKRLSPSIPCRGQWLVPTIVQFELVKWITRAQGAEHADNALAFSMTCQIVTLDTRIARAAADIAAQHALSVADAIIYATAQVARADLLTCDAHFKALDGVIYIPKPAV